MKNSPVLGVQSNRDGKVLTFASAGVSLKVNLRPLTSAELPGYVRLTEAVSKLRMDQSLRDELLVSILPAGNRKYFAVDRDTLSREARQGLIEAYYSALDAKIPRDQLVVLAFTKGQETFLLPEFFKVDQEIGQASVLFQEALWVLRPGTMNERTATTGQILFENYLHDHSDLVGYDPSLYHFLGKIFHSCTLALTAAARADHAAGRLAPFMDSKNRISLKTLFGPNWIVKATGGWDINARLQIKKFLVDQAALNPEVATFSELLMGIDPKISRHSMMPQPKSALYFYGDFYNTGSDATQASLVAGLESNASINLWDESFSEPTQLEVPYQLHSSGPQMSHQIELEKGTLGGWTSGGARLYISCGAEDNE